MPKYSLNITSVPDHKAQVVLARIIVGADSMISIQQAIKMAANPPLLLFHNLEHKDLEQHSEHLKSLGVEFTIAEVQEELDASEVNFGERAETPEPAQELPTPEEPAPPPEPEPPTPEAAAAEPPKQPPPEARSQPSAPPKHPGQSAPAAHAAAIRAAGSASRKKSLIITYAALAAILIIGLLLLILPKGDKSAAESAAGIAAAEAKRENEPAPAETNAGGNAGQNAAVVSNAPPAGGEPRVQPTARQKERAAAYIDSARAGSRDALKSLTFYKMAISFNRRNLAAWQGLLQAYRELHMDSDAYETERQMKEIFGDGTLSVGNVVKAYGELIDAYINEDGAQTVEYKTTKSSKVDILRDVFGMTRAVRAACKCDNISIHVSTRSGKSVTAHSSRQTSVHTLSEFMRQAEIVWLDD